MSDLKPQVIDQNQDGNPDLLESMFSGARADEPGMVDQKMTKVVINTLPKRVIRAKKRSLLFDMIGLVLGLIVAYLYFDVSQAFVLGMSLIPESLSITVENVVMLFFGSVVFAIVAFWVGEQAIK